MGETPKPLHSRQAGTPAATGVITGRVFNPATGEYVRNAEIATRGGTRLAISENNGAYRLTDIPAGEVEILKLFAFTVSSERERNAKVIMEQRNSMNITNRRLRRVRRYGRGQHRRFRAHSPRHRPREPSQGGVW